MNKSDLISGSAVRLLVSLALAGFYLHMQFSLPASFSVFYHLGFGVAGIGSFLLFRNKESAAVPRPLVWIAAMSTCLAPLLAGLLGIQNIVLLVVAGLLCGGGALVLFSQLFAELCSYPTETAFDLVLLSSVLEPVFRLALIPVDMVSPKVSLVIFCVVPLAVAALVQKPQGSALRHGEEAGRKHVQPSSPRRSSFPLGTAGVAAEIVLFGVIFGIMHFATSDVVLQPFAIAHVLQILIPALLLAWLHTSARKESRNFAFKLAAGLVLVAYFATIFFGDARQSAIPVSVILICDVVSAFFLLTFYHTVKVYGKNPLMVFGLGRGLFELSLVVGILTLETPFFDVVSQATDGVIYFGVIIAVLIMINRFLLIVKMGTSASPLEEKSGINDALRKRCTDLGAAKNLSERQMEVMFLVCRGFTKSVIAKELYVSESTVRWHVKQLYNKLGIHNKQELIDLVEGRS